MVLFLVGGLLGVGLGSFVLRLLLRVAPPALAFLGEVSLDGPLVVIALGMAALTGMLFGVLPSWKTAGADFVEVVATCGKGPPSAACHKGSGVYSWFRRSPWRPSSFRPRAS
jgi:hypothetical protein